MVLRIGEIAERNGKRQIVSDTRANEAQRIALGPGTFQIHSMAWHMNAQSLDTLVGITRNSWTRFQ
jgi:hypothetical protein